MKNKSDILPLDSQPSTEESKNSLDELRKLIDKIDDELLEILAKRMKVSVKIGKIKKENNIPIEQSDRWRDLIKDRLNKAKNLNLNSNFIQKILQLIHEESVQKQNEIINK